MTNFHKLQDIPAHKIPVGSLQMLAGAQLMVFWADVDANTHAAKHAHPHEQITWLVEGKMDYQIGDGPVQSLEAGSVLLVPGNTPHEAWYREKCRIVEFFNPPRFDLFPAAQANPYGVAEQK